MKTVNTFLKFVESVTKGTNKRGTFTIRRHEKEGIVAIHHSNIEYANFSGATNGGVTFHYIPDWHTANKDQYAAWKNHLADKTNANKFLATLASEGGVYVCLSGSRIQILTHEELGRTIYDLGKGVR